MIFNPSQLFPLTLTDITSSHQISDNNAEIKVFLSRPDWIPRLSFLFVSFAVCGVTLCQALRVDLI